MDPRFTDVSYITECALHRREGQSYCLEGMEKAPLKLPKDERAARRPRLGSWTVGIWLPSWLGSKCVAGNVLSGNADADCDILVIVSY